tara:strand:- start:187 stop:369 length:183 start_codon:yes stop_codon:yes gene_type:complete
MLTLEIFDYKRESRTYRHTIRYVKKERHPKTPVCQDALLNEKKILEIMNKLNRIIKTLVI